MTETEAEESEGDGESDDADARMPIFTKEAQTIGEFKEE